MDHEHVHGEADKLGSELREALVTFFGPAHLQAEVLSFNIAKVAQPVPEFFEVSESRYIGLAGVAGDTDPWDLRAWLCIRISHTPSNSYETKTPLYRPGRKKAP